MTMFEQEILNRLARLERSNRRFRIGALALLAGVFGAYFLGAEQRFQDLTVEQLRVVDAGGKLRGALGSDRDGTFFFLNDPSGNMRTSMAAQKNGTFFNLKDSKEKSRVLLSFDDEGAVISAKDDRGLFAKLVTDDRGPAVQVGQDGGRVRIIAPMIDLLQEPEKELPKK
jgi:hypothetical protein